MKTQIIEKNGKKEFVVITYKDFMKISEALEDYEDLKELRKAKKASRKEDPLPFGKVVEELGLK